MMMREEEIVYCKHTQTQTHSPKAMKALKRVKKGEKIFGKSKKEEERRER